VWNVSTLEKPVYSDLFIAPVALGHQKQPSSE
jgi:hypothetical protein